MDTAKRKDSPPIDFATKELQMRLDMLLQANQF